MSIKRRKKKILVIEDENETRDLFVRCLSFEKFSPIEASNGETGVQLALQHQPDLIVCDIMMPGMDGYGVLKAIRAKDSLLSVPFIFLTAKVTMEELRQGMALGADDYLIKPCTVEQFLRAIATRLRRNQEIQYRNLSHQNLSYHNLSSHNLSYTREPQKEQVATVALSNIFPDCPKLAPVFQFIDTHYQQPIHLSDVASAAGYSPAYLTNLAQSHTGRTVKKWITERRMVQARQLLQESAHSIKQIAEEIGYADPGYFTRQFRKQHGVTPRAWRKRR